MTRQPSVIDHPTCYDALCWVVRCRDFQDQKKPGENLEAFLRRTLGKQAEVKP